MRIREEIHPPGSTVSVEGTPDGGVRVVTVTPDVPEPDPPGPRLKLPTWMDDPAAHFRDGLETIEPTRQDTIWLDHDGVAPETAHLGVRRKVFDAVKIISQRRTGVIYHKRPHWHANAEKLSGLRFRDFELTPWTPWRDGNYWSGTEWGFRLYNVDMLRLENGWIHGINSQHEGHAVYVDPSGPGTYKNLVIEGCGGQALQIVNREWDQPPSNLPVGPGTTVIENVKVRNCGFNPSRGAHAVTVRALGPEHDLEISNLDLFVDWGEPQLRSGKQVRSAGGVYVGQPDQQPRTYDFDFFRRVTIRDCRVHLVDPHQSVLKVDGCKELVVEHCEFVGGPVHLANGNGPGVRKLTWRRNTGDAPVYHRGERIGSAADELTL